MTKKHKLSERGRRRVAERAAADHVRDRARLARLEPGGTPERPITVEAVPLVELRATGTPCALCDGPLQLDEHAAETHGGVSLRVARLTCRRCHARRELYFLLAPPRPN